MQQTTEIDGAGTRAERAVLGSLLAVVVLAGAGLRFWHLGASRLNFDESFTAMAGRLPLESLLRYLRASDSHPPLDYILRAPLARAGVSAFAMRLPSVLCSVAALIAFGLWTRRFGRTGLYATVLMALSVFEVQYGREARMYAELQLIGVLAIVLLYSYLQSPTPRCALALGTLTLVALLTHVSGLLLAGGLIAGAGSFRSRDANRLRLSALAAVVIWAGLWGPSFVAQTHGHHSSWIPHTTIARAVSVVGSLVVPWKIAATVVCIAIVAGAVVIRQRDRVLARTWWSCSGLPILAAIVCGRFAPVLIDRTLTIFSCGVFLAVGAALDRVTAHRNVLSAIAMTALAAGLVASVAPTVSAPAGPDAPLRALEAVARPGDVAAVRPPSKGVELAWSLGVRSSHGAWRAVEVDLPSTPAIEYSGAAATDRVWLLDFHTRVQPYRRFQRCAPDRLTHGVRIMCIRARVHVPDDVTLDVAHAWTRV